MDKRFGRTRDKMNWSEARGTRGVRLESPNRTDDRPIPCEQTDDRGAVGRELQALRRSEAVLRDFIETSTIALHWVGPDGTILWANQAELDLLGYTRDEYIGRNIVEFHADESVINNMLACLAGVRHCLIIQRGYGIGMARSATSS